MVDTEHDGEGLGESRIQTDSEITAEQGRLFEDISVARIERNTGLRVVDRQMSLPDDYPVTGHPDGRLSPNRGTTHYPGGEEIDGLIWGWEHKHLGRYAYTSVLKQGLQTAEPNFVLQATLYGDALGWDAAYFTITSQDASAIRGDITQNLRAKTPGWAAQKGLHPKVTLVPVDLRPLYHSLIPMAHNRAMWLTKWKEESGDVADVRRESNPNNMADRPVVDEDGNVQHRPFPAGDDALCGYCPYLRQCRLMGQSGEAAPKLPWTKDGD